jgi:hypothetical protein
MAVFAVFAAQDGEKAGNTRIDEKLFAGMGAAG